MNESRLLLLQLRRIITAAASTSSVAGSYRKTYFRRLTALNILLQKQKFLELKLKPLLAITTESLNTNNNNIGRRLPLHLPTVMENWNLRVKSRKLSALNGLRKKQRNYEQVIVKFKPALVQYYTSLKGDKKENNVSATDRIIINENEVPSPTLKMSPIRLRLRNLAKAGDTVTENIWTIPNALCVMRIGMAPAVAYLILNDQFGPAIGVFAAAGVTDLLDGYIARVVPGQSSVMGSFLDPMADKILVGTLFLSLTYMDLIPVPLTALIIGRDAILIMAGFYIRYQSLDPPRTLSRYFNVAYPTAQLAPTMISKINTGIQLGLVGVTLVSTVFPYDIQTFLQLLWYGTATTTIASAIGYLFAKDTVKMLRSKRIQQK